MINFTSALDTVFTPNVDTFAVQCSGGVAQLERRNSTTGIWIPITVLANGQGENISNSVAGMAYRFTGVDGNPVVSADGGTATGMVSQAMPDLAFSEMANYYNFDIASGEFVKYISTPNGRSVTALSLNPLEEDSASIITLANPIFSIPHQLEIEASLSQRTKGDYAVFEVVDADMVTATTTPVAISTIQQTTTTLTIVLTTAVHTLRIGDWINVYGVTDTRFNYCNLTIGTMSLDGLTLTCTVAEDATLPSVTAGPYSEGFVKDVIQFLGRSDGYGMRFSGAVATSAAFISRFAENDTMSSGTFTGSHLATIGSTAPVFAGAATGNYDVRSTSRYAFKVDPQSIAFMDRAVDLSAQYTVRALRSAVKPSLQKSYKARFRGMTPKSITRPVAKIVSAARAGSTTVTVTTRSAHGLVTGNYVACKGCRDYATNFPNMTVAAPVTVIDATSFTVVWGAAVTTVTSYGGSVHLCNGSVDQPGALTTIALQVSRDAAGAVTVIGSATWAGTVTGEYVNLYGCSADGTGADLLLDGVYEVSSIATSTLVLRPVTESLTSQVITPTGGVIGLTNCSGTVIQRTTLRAHDILIEEYKQSRVQIDGAGTFDLARSIPVSVMNAPVVSGTVTATQGVAATVSATTGLGGWPIHQAIVGLPDIASAAITATATSASIANALGNGFQVNIAVTAATGTSPTLDVRVEESFDGGTNWVTLYEFQRITATGSYNSPIMRATGRNIRYVRTITGTTPSFTMAVVRNILPFIQAEPQKRLMDRSIVLTTLNSTTPVLFQGAANNVQLVVSVGAITTTAPQLQIEGSEDGVNFYPMGTPLTAVASSTVETTITAQSATYTRARVSTAGVGVTAGYTCLKAWS